MTLSGGWISPLLNQLRGQSPLKPNGGGISPLLKLHPKRTFFFNGGVLRGCSLPPQVWEISRFARDDFS